MEHSKRFFSEFVPVANAFWKGTMTLADVEHWSGDAGGANGEAGQDTANRMRSSLEICAPIAMIQTVQSLETGGVRFHAMFGDRSLGFVVAEAVADSLCHRMAYHGMSHMKQIDGTLAG